MTPAAPALAIPGVSLAPPAEPALPVAGLPAAAASGGALPDGMLSDEALDDVVGGLARVWYGAMDPRSAAGEDGSRG